jgi:hypothetical protein
MLHSNRPWRETDLTVVVACVDACKSIDRCLAALDEACSNVRSQVIVADASSDGTAAVVRSHWPQVRLLTRPVGTLVPELWAAGLCVAEGRVVAFMTGHLLVARPWADALLAGTADATGVGGPLTIARDASALVRAVFYLRYAAFTPWQLPDGITAGEIAGDNAAYVRDALKQHASSLTDGFWEIEFHRCLRTDGKRLRVAADATARFVGCPPFWCTARHRFAHGRHFGAQRVAQGASRFRIVCAAPVIPFVLAWRAGCSTAVVHEHRVPYLTALPLLLPLAAAWAAGEAWGAIRGSGRRRS